MKPSNTSRGEGDYASAKKYNQQARAYAQSGKAEQAARDAAPRNPGQKQAPGKYPDGSNPVPEKLPGR